MLILTRKMGQEICIGEDVVVKVINLNVHGIEIGISAPKDLEIVRKEIRKDAHPHRRKLGGAEA